MKIKFSLLILKTFSSFAADFFQFSMKRTRNFFNLRQEINVIYLNSTFTLIALFKLKNSIFFTFS